MVIDINQPISYHEGTGSWFKSYQITANGMDGSL